MPPIQINYPLINGHRYSPSSVELQIQTPGGVYLLAPAGVKSLSYATGLEPGEVRGLSPQIVGRTRGTQADEASMEMFMLEFENLRGNLNGGVGFMEVPWNMNITLWEPPVAGIQPPPVMNHAIIGVRIKKATVNGITSGNDALSVSLDLSVMRVLLGPNQPGITPFAPMGI
jgi:hypothetical protein